jgi:hypothetical protein
MRVLFEFHFCFFKIRFMVLCSLTLIRCPGASAGAGVCYMLVQDPGKGMSVFFVCSSLFFVNGLFCAISLFFFVLVLVLVLV